MKNVSENQKRLIEIFGTSDLNEIEQIVKTLESRINELETEIEEQEKENPED